MHIPDAQALLHQLRSTAHAHPPAATVGADERRALKLAAQLLVRRPGTATRLFLMAVEQEAHEVTDTQVEGRLTGGGDGPHE